LRGVVHLGNAPKFCKRGIKMFYIFEVQNAKKASWKKEAIKISESFARPVIIEVKSIVVPPKKSLFERIKNTLRKN
jgi:hypothetical protein